MLIGQPQSSSSSTTPKETNQPGSSTNPETISTTEDRSPKPPSLWDSFHSKARKANQTPASKNLPSEGQPQTESKEPNR
jgi:hypothetical protein